MNDDIENPNEGKSKLPVFAAEAPSDTFTQELVSGGGIVADCEFCGRTFFEDETTAGSWEPGELEALEKKAIEEPDRYIAMDGVSHGRINGKQAVIGCPCNALRKYEDFIWSNRKFIMSYLSQRVKDIVEEALKDEASAEQASIDLTQAEKADRKVKCIRCRNTVREIAINQGGICTKCWGALQKEAEEDRERLRIAAEEEEKKRLDEEDNLPF